MKSFIFDTNDLAATTAIGSNGSTRPKLENPGILLGLDRAPGLGSRGEHQVGRRCSQGDHQVITRWAPEVGTKDSSLKQT